MRIALIIWGVILLIVAMLVIVAQNALLLGFIPLNEPVSKYIVTGCLVVVGAVLLVLGVKMKPEHKS